MRRANNFAIAKKIHSLKKMLRFGQSFLTVQYYCSWEQTNLIPQERILFEYFHRLVERLMCHGFHTAPIVRQFCLGTCVNEHLGRLLLVCDRFLESGMHFWRWNFFKVFESPSEFVEESLDALFHSVPDHVIPFKLFHRQSLERHFQLLYQCTINSHLGTTTNETIATELSKKIMQLVYEHFPDFIWTHHELYDRVSCVWKCKILKEGNVWTRSKWIRPYWIYLQRYFEEAWEDFKNLRSKSFQFPREFKQRSYEYIRFPLDNFLSSNGIGQTFEFKPWKNWTFTTCSIAFFCKQRTHVKWGVHPFVSCLDEQRSEQEMHWFGSDVLTCRFVFQQPGNRPCDTFVFDADCCTSHHTLIDKDVRSSLLWLFGHALEQCLMQHIENIIFDELGNQCKNKSPFSFMDRIRDAYAACSCEDQEILPMRIPLFEYPHDLF